MRRLSLFLLLLCLCAVPKLSAQVYQPSTCSNAFSRDQEITEGAKVVAQVYKEMPVLPDTDPVSQYVRRIGERLVAAAPGTPGMQQAWPFRIHVVASSEINAFALPGGTMFVNLGAVQAAETEAQLAGVMGHEMSHVILRHSTCNLTRQRKKSVFYGILGIGSALVLGDGAAGSLAQAGLGIGQGLDFLHMSRGDEQQADLLGVQITHDAGYDPRGLPQFFEIIQAKYGKGGAQFLSDHPNPGNRTAYVNAEIAQLTPLDRPTINTPGFRQVKAQASSMPVYDAKQTQAGTWRTTGLYAPGPDAAARAGATPAGYPYSGNNAPSGGGNEAASASLGVEQVGINDPLTRYQAPLWSIMTPRRWTATAAANGDVTLAPPGGNGRGGLAYGVFAGVARQSDQGVSDATSLGAATQTFVQALAQHDALTVSGRLSSGVVGGRPAAMLDLAGGSPVYAGGGALPEHDWLITIARPDGDMDFFLFVCPERDFASLRPLFVRIRDSIRPQ